MKRGEDERRAREEVGGVGAQEEEVERVNKWQRMKGGGRGGR